MTDNFDFKKFLLENKLGAYSKAGLINEEASDDLRALKSEFPSPSAYDVKNFFNLPSIEDAKAKMMDLGLNPDAGRQFRSGQQQSDYEYRRQKALRAVDNPRSELKFKTSDAMWKYANAVGVDLWQLTQQSKTEDDFVKYVLAQPKLKGFNTPHTIEGLKRFYKERKQAK